MPHSNPAENDITIKGVQNKEVKRFMTLWADLLNKRKPNNKLNIS